MPTFSAFSENEKTVVDFMKKMYHQMVEEPSGIITHPFLSPGPAYGGQLWDWDFCLHIKGLTDLYKYCKDDVDFDADKLKNIIIRHGKGGVEEFVDMQYENGFLPIMTSTTGDWWRIYSKIQKERGGEFNQHKPFLCWTTALVAEFVEDIEWLKGCYPTLKKYLKYYDETQFDSRIGLYYYHNDDMIGVDNTPTVFGRPWNSSADIFLNNFIAHDLEQMIGIADKLGYEDDKKYYEQKLKDLYAAINKYCYSRRDGFYYAVDRMVETHRTELIHVGMDAFWNCVQLNIRVAGGFFTLTSGAATEESAERLVKEHLADPCFKSPYGVRTLAADEIMYYTEPTQNPSNCCGPIWIHTNYFIFNGLLRYGYIKEAEELCAATLDLLAKNINNHGEIAEFYDPDNAEPKLLGGAFMGFNILVMSMLRELRDAKENIEV